MFFADTYMGTQYTCKESLLYVVVECLVSCLSEKTLSVECPETQ